MVSTRCRLLFLWLAAFSGAATSADCPSSFYANSQLAAGAALYERVCASCHGPALKGGAAMALAGNAFDSRWRLRGRTVGDLYYVISTQMPAGEPGKLSTSEYLDVVAFVLHSNGYPGAADLQVRSPLELDGLDLGTCR
jgi:polar amino acid transport system substrate-binding protein